MVNSSKNPPDDSVDRKMLSSGERLAVVLFVVANLIGPLLGADLYPFSRYTMFSHHPESLSLLVAEDQDGNAVRLQHFGVRHTYLANPYFRIGLRPEEPHFRWLAEPYTEAELGSMIVNEPGQEGVRTISVVQTTTTVNELGVVERLVEGPWVYEVSP